MVAALSPSRASDFLQCPLLYRLRVIDRLPEPPSPAAARGTLVHAALERIFDADAQERTVEATQALLPQEWQRMVGDDPQLAALAGASDDELARWFAQAEKLVERWFTLENPQRLEPEARELYVEVDLDGLTLRGYIDRLDVAPTGAIRVVDYKTGRSPSPQYEAKALFQMKCYALAIWKLRGQIPLMLQLVYLGNGEVLRYQPSEQDLRGLMRKLQAIRVAIERAARTGDFRPRTSYLCNFCHYKTLCPQFGGTPPPLPEHAELVALNPRALETDDDAEGDDDLDVDDPCEGDGSAV